MAERKISFVEGSAPNSSALKGAIQLGIAHSEESLSQKPYRDILMQDFEQEESMFFPSEGGNLSPAHGYGDFTFKTFAPIAFRYFRDVFGVRPDDYRTSLCNDMSLIERSDSEDDGSLFYVSSDDKFVIKTVRHKEVSVLQRLLPGYYMNLNQNRRTLMPKLYGLYCVQAGGKTIHTVVVVNNLLPCDVQMHLRYHLKGSTYKRRALAKETDKAVPTYKDLDFLDMPSLVLDADKYKAISETIRKDCKVLQNFDIMNYRLLVGVHNVDRACREQAGEGAAEQRRPQGQKSLYSTGVEAIQGEASSYAEDHMGGIPARNTKGERLLLYIGITDILQSYTLGKKLEYSWKSFIYDGESISVHRPRFYAERFQRFMCNTVFINLQLKIPAFKKVPKKREAPPPPLTLTPTPTPTPSPSAPPPSPPYPALIPPSCCPTLKDVQMHLHHLQLHLHHLVGGDESASSFQGVSSFSSPCTET